MVGRRWPLARLWRQWRASLRRRAPSGTWRLTTPLQAGLQRQAREPRAAGDDPLHASPGVGDVGEADGRRRAGGTRPPARLSSFSFPSGRPPRRAPPRVLPHADRRSPAPTTVAPSRLLPRADRRRRRTPGSAPARRPLALPHADAQRSMAGRSGTQVALLAATGGGDGRAGSASAAAT